MTFDFLEVAASVGLRDLVDIALLAAIIYWLLQLIKGTRAIPILLGLTVLLVAFGLSSYLELEAISWLMENLFSSTVIILVVLFQADIRNALARLGISTLLRESSASARQGLIQEVAEAAKALAGKRIGATIVLERETGLRNYIDRGKTIMGEPTVELLLSIFHTSSPLHDGAAIINREGKLAAARCILPLSSQAASSALIGTRHRSALGLTEETDAVAIVVSEERGNISVAFRGVLLRDLAGAELSRKISQFLHAEDNEDSPTEVSPRKRAG